MLNFLNLVNNGGIYLLNMRSSLLLLMLILGLVPAEAFAESVTMDFGNVSDGAFSSKLVQLVALLTVLSLAPSILVMVTSFTKIVIVLSILRTALGLQQSPPNSVLTSLALFLTFFIMSPVFEKSYNDGIKPLIEERMDEIKAFPKIAEPFRLFMLDNVREKDLQLFLEIAKIEPSQKDAIPLTVITPAYMLSELKRAFEIGFLIFLPFLIIDMVVASTLMAMGMMMIPPVMISLPFKLIFFVMIDGWYMLTASLVRSYGL